MDVQDFMTAYSAWHTDELTDKRTDRHTNTQSDIQQNWQTNGRTDTQTHSQTYNRTDRQTDGQTYRQADRQSDKRTVREGKTNGSNEIIDKDIGHIREWLLAVQYLMWRRIGVHGPNSDYITTAVTCWCL